MLLKLNDIIILTIINVHKALAAIQKYDVAVIVVRNVQMAQESGKFNSGPNWFIVGNI